MSQVKITLQLRLYMIQSNWRLPWSCPEAYGLNSGSFDRFCLPLSIHRYLFGSTRAHSSDSFEISYAWQNAETLMLSLPIQNCLES